MKKLFILLWLFPVVALASTNDSLYRPIHISVFSNATLLPGSGFAGIVNTPTHPGFTIGSGFNYRQTEHNSLFQTFKLGYFYHRLAQHALQLYSEAGYQHQFNCGFSFRTLLGLGYLHSIPDMEVFELNSDGEYERAGRLGRPQGMGGLTIGIGYNINKKSNHPMRIGLDYQVWFQFPFVQEYVPVLPNTTLHLSFTYHIPKSTSK